jgi:hypothetical protein
MKEKSGTEPREDTETEAEYWARQPATKDDTTGIAFRWDTGRPMNGEEIIEVKRIVHWYRETETEGAHRMPRAWALQLLSDPAATLPVKEPNDVYRRFALRLLATAEFPDLPDVASTIRSARQLRDFCDKEIETALRQAGGDAPKGN